MVEMLADEHVLDSGCARKWRGAGEVEVPDYLGGIHGWDRCWSEGRNLGERGDRDGDGDEAGFLRGRGSWPP